MGVSAGATGRPSLRRRKSMRLQGYDYAQPGAYFVTLCTQDRACIFGEIVGSQMRSNTMGHIVADCWQAIPSHFQTVELDAWVAMPNHFHGIVWITDVPVGAPHAAPLHASPPPRRPLGTIVGSFKSATARRINTLRGTPGMPVWQRNYHERIVRSHASLNDIREYIHVNPARWAMDRENPSMHCA